uniref:Uncharacterized protein n=1 Tax=Lactuca sativa TaxID=4236 RepID=A0A9R1XDT9_LACSA|nr:hypothetical protein LSAT_V11C500233850 [Lactuca sativa]
MGAIPALAMGLDFNFSRYILNEMVGNVEGKRKDRFLMFPRFLQMIFNNKYPELEKRGEILDLKSIGSNTFELMKQNRKGKFMFEGKNPLVKFGQFAEVSNASETKSSSDHIETEDEVIIASEHEEEHVAPVAIITKEHVPITDDVENDDKNANDDDESDFEMSLIENVVNEDDGEDDMDQCEDLNGYDNDDLIFGFEQDQDIWLSAKDLDDFFNNVNKVAQSATETEGDDDVLKTTPPTSTQMVDPSNIMDSTSRIPPLPVDIPKSLPSEDDLTLTHDGF